LLARHCHQTLDSRSLLEEVMDCLLSLLGAERGFIVLRTADGSTRPAISRKIDLSAGDTFSGTVVDRVMASGQGMLVSDASTDPAMMNQKSVVSGHIRSTLAAPILSEGAATGAIYLDCLVSRRIFGPHDLALLSAAAEHVAAALKNSQAQETLRRQTTRMKLVVDHEARREHDPSAIIGTSAAMKRVISAVEKVAAQSTSTLLLGESGTGKELIARSVHELSPRAAGPFVAVNCMALSPELLESELFGHEKGAFTGATDRRLGRFELAEGGTIFLDEIGELAAGVQVKLLRVLQENVIERVGSGKPQKIDTRLVCATHVDLEAAVQAGRFRQDLFYRIAVFPIVVPPLRDRKDDVPALAEHFVKLFARRMGKPIHGLTPAALESLKTYHWPGNIRELRNLIERAFVLETGELITAESLPIGSSAYRPQAPGAAAPKADGGAGTAMRGGLATARDAFEKAFILGCMERHQGNVLKAARELEIPRSTIYRKLIAWGMSPAGTEPTEE
jgi:two-component system response regulator HydG